MTSRNHQQFDELDQQLIAELQKDARLAFATLGSRLGVTGMTAANRLQRLRQSDLIRFRVNPNLEACGVRTQVLGLIQVDAAAMQVCIDRLRASSAVIRAEQVTGEYDLAFFAAFASEALLGTFVRELQAIPGVRRLVVHHQLEAIKDEDGWGAVWAEQEEPEREEGFELAPGVELDPATRSLVRIGTSWSDALVAGDLETLERLSHPDIEFVIHENVRGAGTFIGLDGVAQAARNVSAVSRKLWQLIAGVSEAQDPYTIIVDTVTTLERARGQVRTGFARIAYGFEGSRVRRVANLGGLELPAMSEATAVSASPFGNDATPS